MVRILVEKIVPNTTTDPRKKYVEIACKSTDTKPTNEEWVSGSVLIEVDTGSAYCQCNQRNPPRPHTFTSTKSEPEAVPLRLRF